MRVGIMLGRCLLATVLVGPLALASPASGRGQVIDSIAHPISDACGGRLDPVGYVLQRAPDVGLSRDEVARISAIGGDVDARNRTLGERWWRELRDEDSGPNREVFEDLLANYREALHAMRGIVGEERWALALHPPLEGGSDATIRCLARSIRTILGGDAVVPAPPDPIHSSPDDVPQEYRTYSNAIVEWGSAASRASARAFISASQVVTGRAAPTVAADARRQVDDANQKLTLLAGATVPADLAEVHQAYVAALRALIDRSARLVAVAERRASDTTGEHKQEINRAGLKEMMTGGDLSVTHDQALDRVLLILRSHGVPIGVSPSGAPR